MEPSSLIRTFPAASLNDPAILISAEELVKAGWNGVDQEYFAPFLGNDKIWKGYHVVFQLKDFPQIQKVAQEILSNQRVAITTSR